MKQYLDILQYVLENGTLKSDRTGTGTLSKFGFQSRYDLQKGFPLVTTKKLHLKSVVHELLWFLSGDTNIKYLQDNGVRIWNEWADENGDLGPVYGQQWRKWQNTKPVMSNGSFLGFKTEHIDQISNVIEQIKDNAHSRRHLVIAYNPGDIDNMALPPCHFAFQFYVENGKLSCMLYQRSADLFLGVPFNIASYALLTHMVAHVVGLEVGEFIHTIGDAHIYTDHIEKVELQLQREPLPLPTLKIKRDVKNIFDFKYDDFEFIDYHHHPHIAGKVSV